MRDYSILDDLDEGVQIIDHDMRYVYLNNILLKEVGCDRSEIFGRKMAEKFPGIELSEIYQEIKSCMATGKSRSYINEFKFPDGRHTYYDLKIQSVNEGAILFSRDITKNRRGEFLLQETNRQLEHFVHIAAHDLREPVRRMSFLSEELLLDYAGIMPQEAQQICKNLQQQSRDLFRLINDLRTLSGIDKVEPEMQEAKVDKIAIESFREIEQKHAANFQISFSDTALNLYCYPSLVGLLFKNLFENVFQHGEKRMILDINLDNLDSGPVVSIGNLFSTTLPNQDIFLPFVKGKHSSGSGLGLTICKKAVLLHGGEIWVDVKGNEFRLNFTLGKSNRGK